MVWQRRGNPRVHDHEPYAHRASHHADRCAARQEVQHHLRSNFLGIARDALCDHAVIACGYDYCLTARIRPLGAKDAGQLDGELLQPPQASSRLGQPILPKRGRLRILGRSWPDTRNYVVEIWF